MIDVDVAAGSGVSVDVVRGLCASGELVARRFKDGDYWVNGVHLMPVGRDDVLVDGWALFPDSVRLVAELRGLGWLLLLSMRVSVGSMWMRFLRLRSMWGSRL